MKIKKVWVTWEELNELLGGWNPAVGIDAINVGGLTPGSIPFANATGNLTEDNAALFWDETNEILKITSASTLLLDLNPGFTGTGEVINITPSAALDTEDAEWDGITIDGNLLDPSVIGCFIHGIHLDFSTMDMTNLPHIDALHIQMPAMPAMMGTHAIHVNCDYYAEIDLSNMVAGQTATVFDVVLATAGATGGMIHALDVARAGGGTISTVAVGTHTGIDVIHQHIGTATAFDKVWEFNGGWTDVTAACGNPAVDVAIWEAQDDVVYFGHSTVYDEIECIFATVATKNMHFDFHYSDGATGWIQFYPADDTNGAQVDGLIRWLTSDIGAWAADTVNGTANKYWIRITRTRLVGTGPTEDTIKFIKGTTYGWDENGIVTIAGLTIIDIFSHDYVTDNNLLMGYLAGEDLGAGTGQYNTIFGQEAGMENVTGDYNTIVGYQAGMGVAANSFGDVTLMGYQAGFSITTASYLVAVGSMAGYNLTSGGYGVYVGAGAGLENVTGGNNVCVGNNAGLGVAGQSHNYNTFLGDDSGYSITTGQENTCVGASSGYHITSGDGNVCLGYMAGETNLTVGNNQLWIANSNTATPLIYGEFDNNLLKFNADVEILSNQELRFYDNGNYVGFEAPALTADQIWVLPDEDGDNLDFLQTDGAGNLSWAPAGGGTTIKSNWGYVAGDGDTSCQEVVTFDQAFTNIPDIVVNCLGYKDGTPANRGDVTVGVDYVCTAQDPSTTGFTLVATDTAGNVIPTAGGVVDITVTEAGQGGGINSNTSYEEYAEIFQPTENITVYSVKVFLLKLGNITAGKKIWIEIWSDNAGVPNAIVANGTSALLEADSVGDVDYVETEFTFSTPPTANTGTDYHVVVIADYVNSGANVIKVGLDSTPTYTAAYIWKLGAWSNADGWAFGFKVYKVTTGRNVAYSWMAKEPGTD